MPSNSSIVQQVKSMAPCACGCRVLRGHLSPSKLHVSEVCRVPAPARSTGTQAGTSPGKNSHEQWKFSKDFATFFPEAVSACKLINTSVHVHKYLMNAGLKRRRWEFSRHCLALVFRRRKGQHKRNPRDRTTRRGRRPTSMLCVVAACRGRPLGASECPPSGLRRQRGGQLGKWPPKGALVTATGTGHKDHSVSSFSDNFCW